MQSKAIFAESEFKRRRSHERNGVGAAAMTIRRQRASTSCRLDQGLDLLRHQQREIAMYKNHGLRWLPGAKSREFLVKTAPLILRSEEHTSELQSLMRISYAVFCLKKKTQQKLKK